MTSKNVLRRATATAIGGVVVAGLTGCSSTPDADPVAQTLAEAVASGDFTGVPLTGATAEDVATAAEELTSSMGAATRTVEVAGIEETDDEDRRQVTLDVSWDLDAVAETGTATTPAEDDATADWTYQATATLVAADTDAGWEVEWAPTVLHPDLADGASLALRRQQADRADIMGAGGEVIVTERPVYRIGIDKTQVDAAAAPASATALAELVGVDAAAFAGRVEAAGERAYVEAITLREADAAAFLAGIEQVEGAVALSDTQALAPTREFARPVLGSVGEATAEIVDESAGGVVAGDLVGLSGLQAQYDAQLAGTPGLTVELTPAEGDAQVLFEQEPVAGTPLPTPLSVELQVRAEALLAGVAPASAIVAVQPSTGSVLAAASGPGGEGYSTATLGQYAPGSTFKIATSLGLLRAGLTAESTVTCSPAVTVDGRAFENYSDYPSGAIGEITLRAAIANSCNTAMISQNETVDQAALAQAAASLGLGAEHDAGAAAFLGSVPPEADGTAHAASMIGQGEVLASPLAMATMAASVAAGQTVAPVFVEGAGAEPPASTLTEEEALTLRELMLAVVDEGSGAFLGSVPGEPVGAKTGTAEYGSEQPPRTHAWMIAFQGDLAVAVFVEDGESGSQTAGPLLEAFLRG